MNRTDLYKEITAKKSYLCVGLDTSLDRIPKHLLKYSDPIFEFNKEIIDATRNYCVAYKPNLAFYEALGPSGWISLEKTIKYIPEEMFTIADAKRGDIGNTCARYAEAFFKTYDFDAVTVSPFMGSDAIEPFLQYENKWAIVLALTSNPGSEKFLNLKTEGGLRLFEWVLNEYKQLGTPDNLMFVAGATYAENLSDVRKMVPDHFLLVPGVGAQGGDLTNVAKYGLNDLCGLLVNSSRKIIYASQQEDFAEKAGKIAQDYQQQMSESLQLASSS